jgi:hypothetical protein
MIRILPVALILFTILIAGCSSSVPPQADATPGPTPGSFYLYGNGTFNVNGTLQQVNGTLHIASVPPGADVYIDDTYWCPTNCALPYVIPPGHHTVELRMNGYDTVMYPVTVVKGGMEGINISLVKTQDNRAVASTTTVRP